MIATFLVLIFLIASAGCGMLLRRWHQDKVIDAFGKGCHLGRGFALFTEEELGVLYEGTGLEP